MVLEVHGLLTLTSALADADLDAASLWGVPDGRVLGLCLSVLGLFLVANALLLRSSKSLLEESFGRRRIRLRTIRELLFHRAQMSLGFAFLLVGTLVQLWGQLRPPLADEPAASSTLWIGLVVALGVASEFGAWFWSQAAFRKHLRDWFRENPPDFETDMALAREVGELFGVESSGVDTVQAYVAKLRKAIGIAPVSRSAAERAREGYALEPEEAEESA